MIVLGVDPGFAFLGLAVVELKATSTRLLLHETFSTSPDQDDAVRLDTISDHLLDVIEDHADIEAVGYEDQAGVIACLAQGGKGISAPARRVLEVSGMIRCAARCYDLPVYAMAPTSVKVALLGKGGGHADKARMKRAVQKMFGLSRCSEHSADAIAIAVGAAVRHRRHLVTVQHHADLIH